MKTFREAIQGERFTITADLTLQNHSDAGEIARQADLLGPYVDGIQVTDNPWAWVQMSAVAAASLLLREGIDPIPVLTCRDRNRIALASDLLGLRALGVTSVLLMRGHTIPPGHAVKAAAVFDSDRNELVELAAGIGQSVAAPETEAFFIGVGARVFRPTPGWDAASLQVRSAAGARFLQTQLCFNLTTLRQYMRCLVETRTTWRYSVIVSLAPLPSAATARWIKQNLSDARIPAAVIERLERAADPEKEGIALCAEMICELAEIPGVSGVNLITMGNPKSLHAAIRASGLRS